MHGATSVPAGSSRPPISHRRGQLAQDDRQHRPQAQRLLADGVEVLVACRRALPARRRSSFSGWRTSRSIAHESAVAVVSWPATSSVISSSRTSLSVIGLPSSSVGLEEQRHDVGALLEVGRRAAASRSPRTACGRRARSPSGTGRTWPARCGPSMLRSAQLHGRGGPLEQAPRIAAPSRSRRSASVTPKTARMITSSVTACIAGASCEQHGRPASGRSGGRRHRPSARRTAASARRGRTAASSCAACMCCCSSSSSTEFGPSTGSRTTFASPACTTSGGAVKTCLTARGAATITQGPSLASRIVNMSP